jgi:hypothetical protein
MNQKFNPARNVYLDRDEQGLVRQLLHTHAPVASQARTPLQAWLAVATHSARVFTS